MKKISFYVCYRAENALDTIRMIAIAQTSMVGLLTGPTVDSSDARSLDSKIYSKPKVMYCLILRTSN